MVVSRFGEVSAIPYLYLQCQLINNILCKKKDTTEIGTYPTEPYSLLKNKEEEKKTKNKYEEYHNNVMMQGSIKQIYLEKMKNQNKTTNC